MMRVPLQEDGKAWRDRWVADIRQRARWQIPAWLKEMRMESLRERRIPDTPTVQTVQVHQPAPNPLTPLPLPSPKETGPIPILTQVIPIVKLLPPIDVRDTRELVSSAVRWFWERHGCLPSVVALNPLRCLAISQNYFPIDCEDLGGYTVEIRQEAHLACEEVWLQGRRYAWEEEKIDSYL